LEDQSNESRFIQIQSFLVATRSQLLNLLDVMTQALVQDLETDSLQSLAQATVGCDFHIKMLEGPACDQLRRLGFCETMQVRKLANGRNMICTVCGTRMALSRDLADQVKVAPVPA
jgi:Fe2+ transport system protein FeoA